MSDEVVANMIASVIVAGVFILVAIIELIT
jgi:hypothetical protein